MRIPFSERERGPRPRTSEEVDTRTWGGLVALIHTRIEDGSLGAGFPSFCPDGRDVDGCDRHALEVSVHAEVEIDWPLDAHAVPDDQFAIFDLLEFLHANIGKPEPYFFHPFFRHDHLNFDVPAGQSDFRNQVNHLFSRNGIAFELADSGEIRRLLPHAEAAQLAAATPHTGDAETDRLLEAARRAIASRSIDTRRDGLEKLWDAFERMKTLEALDQPWLDKRASAEAMLDRVAGGPRFRAVLGVEARALTDAGNALRIRHSEIQQEILGGGDQVDYLFFRMLALVRLLLRASGRGS